MSPFPLRRLVFVCRLCASVCTQQSADATGAPKRRGLFQEPPQHTTPPRNSVAARSRRAERGLPAVSAHAARLPAAGGRQERPCQPDVAAVAAVGRRRSSRLSRVTRGRGAVQAEGGEG